MDKPTKEQVDDFLKYISGLEIFIWTHVGDQEPDPNLVAVVDWLKNYKE
jgi:hypothetical protein